jgi:formylmethanofuran dehydrogenase subunit E
MKNNLVIPVPKEEDKVAATKRRETYAATRDLQAIEFNDAIAKRIIMDAKNKVKCEKCGKEFMAVGDSDGSPTCPECK